MVPLQSSSLFLCFALVSGISISSFAFNTQRSECWRVVVKPKLASPISQHLRCIWTSQPSGLCYASPSKVQCTLYIDSNSKWAGTKRSAVQHSFSHQIEQALNSTTHVHIQSMNNAPPTSSWLSRSISGDRLMFGMVHLVDTNLFWGGVSCEIIAIHISRQISMACILQCTQCGSHHALWSNISQRKRRVVQQPSPFWYTCDETSRDVDIMQRRCTSLGDRLLGK